MIKKIIGLLFLTVISLYLIMGFINLAVPIHPTAGYIAIPVDSKVAETAKQIIGAKCIMCHSSTPNLPYYTQLPIAGSVIRKHVKAGTGMMNLHELVAGNSPDRWAYDRLAHVIQNDTMPLQSYLSLHWNGRLTAQEQADLLIWIDQRRAAQE